MAASVLSLCNMNFKTEQWITQSELQEQFKGMTELELGSKNHKTYKNLMVRAEEIRAKLMGAPTWIAQSLSQSSTPQPAIQDAQDRRPWVTTAVGSTSGAAYERGPIAMWTEAPWDPWGQ